MDHFDKRMALDAIEDAFTNLGTPEGQGFAAGLCCAFYMSGLLDEDEWRALLQRIPPGNQHVCKACATGQHGGHESNGVEPC